MATIQIIDNIRLNQKGLQTKDSNNQWVNVHKQQGDLDGACSIYSLVMAMLCQGMIGKDDMKYIVLWIDVLLKVSSYIIFSMSRDLFKMAITIQH